MRAFGVDGWRLAGGAGRVVCAIILASVLPAAPPAEAQQVDERMRSTFARAETLYRTA